MSGYNRFIALIVEREWAVLNSVIDKTDKAERREMASEDFQGDLPFHMAIKLEAPKETLLKLLKAFPKVVTIKDKENQSTIALANDYSAEDEVILKLKKYLIKSNKSNRSLGKDSLSSFQGSMMKLSGSFSNFIRASRDSIRRAISKAHHF